MIHQRFMGPWQGAVMPRSPLIALALLAVAAPTAAQEAPPAASSTAGKPALLAADARKLAYDAGEIAKAADGAFGEASEAVGKVIERVFADLGEPNAYIVGREGAGAIVVGLRYGRGELHHKVEGTRTVHWTGPSIGPDFGGDGSRTFTLVYNLQDSNELFQRFPAVEGRAYLIGGVSANYHQRGDIILVPIRLGGGWRLGANVGYLKYTKEGRVFPF